MYKLILASGSPRRKEILEQIGIKFEVMVSSSEEATVKKDPIDIVKELAYIKADEIEKLSNEDCIVIGADTIVVFENEIMGKPVNEEMAVRMLKKLQGNMHRVYTGVAIFIKKSDSVKVLNFEVETKVFVRAMTDKQIEGYVATKEPMDKAGGYGIQGKFAINIEKIEGDYYNVVGFPISEIYKVLLKENIDLLEFK